MGGWGALDDADRGLLRRLIAIRRAGEVPEPAPTCGVWYAVRGEDQGAVLEAFGLSDPEPVTMRLGAAAAGHTDGRWAYVSPALDGWTLVFANLPLETTEELLGLVAGLSRRFGAAQRYYTFEGCGAWCVAERGALVRYVDNQEPEGQLGAPLPVEVECVRREADELRADDTVDRDRVDAVAGRRDGPPPGVFPV